MGADLGGGGLFSDGVGVEGCGGSGGGYWGGGGFLAVLVVGVGG